jgi:hypothetical protein
MPRHVALDTHPRIRLQRLWHRHLVVCANRARVRKLIATFLRFDRSDIDRERPRRLQILTSDGEWKHVPYVPDSIVVNVSLVRET